jgi:hypothetical protein
MLTYADVYGAFLEELPDTDAQVYVTYADVS